MNIVIGQDLINLWVLPKIVLDNLWLLYSGQKVQKSGIVLPEDALAMHLAPVYHTEP